MAGHPAGIVELAVVGLGIATEKVINGPSAIRFIRAAMVLESSPPLRNIPRARRS